MTEYKAALLLCKFVGDETPCCFNGMDEYVDDWCDKACGNVSPIKCWIHAIRMNWITDSYKQIINDIDEEWRYK